MQHENQRIESVSHFFCESAKLLGLLVDLIGIELMTSSIPWKRAPSCATGPHAELHTLIFPRPLPIRQTSPVRAARARSGRQPLPTAAATHSSPAPPRYCTVTVYTFFRSMLS